MEQNLEWFKNQIAPKLENYVIEYSFFEEGDFGSLNRAEFNNDQKGCTLEFWSSGKMGIHFVDYTTGTEVINLLFEPNETQKKEEAIKKLLNLI